MRLFKLHKRPKHKSVPPPTFKSFLRTYHLCSKELQDEYGTILAMQSRPDTLAGVAVPETLNGLSYGQLDDLSHLKKEDTEVIYRVAEIVLGRVPDILSEDVNKVFGFLNFCRSEVERINKLFADIKPTYTSEQIQAGVEKLQFGSFGVLDWYAKRMGIINQNDVRNVAWVRIYTCMKNDNAEAEYEKRLNDVYMKRAKAKNG